MYTVRTLKTEAIIGLVAMLVLLVGSMVVWKERFFFCDATFITFNILKYQMFYIQENRYGSFMTQMIPYFGEKLGVPIGVIIKAYAFSFNFFYFIVILIVYRCRQYALAVIMPMYYVLIVSDTWYWTNNEIHQAIAWMFVLFSVVMLIGEKKSPWFLVLPVFLALAFLTIFTHFLVLIPLTFLWGFLWLRKEGWPFNNVASAFLTMLLICIVILKFLLVNDNGYDESHLHNVTHFTLQDIFSALRTGVVSKFFENFLTNYWGGGYTVPDWIMDAIA